MQRRGMQDLYFKQTALSTSAELMPGVSALPVRMGRVRASSGKSHSWLTPTTSSPAPIANRISVPLGTRETILMAGGV